MHQGRIIEELMLPQQFDGGFSDSIHGSAVSTRLLADKLRGDLDTVQNN